MIPLNLMSTSSLEPTLKKKKAKPKKARGHVLSLERSLALPDDFDLNEDFKKCFDALERTSSHLYITGDAGTGKTTLLKYVRQNSRKNIAILAPTGIAAINSYGQTLHSFFQFPPQLVHHEHIRKVRHAHKIFSTLELLIIDEASMLRADLMDGMDYALRLN